MTTQRKSLMNEALRALKYAVEHGSEYPDAETSVAYRFKLKTKQVDKLRAMYDADCKPEDVCEVVQGNPPWFGETP